MALFLPFDKYDFLLLPEIIPFSIFIRFNLQISEIFSTTFHFYLFTAKVKEKYIL